MVDKENNEKEYKMAEQMLFEKKFEDAYKLLNIIIEKNSSYSMNAKFRLGQMYYHGSFVKQDGEKAYEYFSQASNHPKANYYLGLMYYYGFYLKKVKSLNLRLFLMNFQEKNLL